MSEITKQTTPYNKVSKAFDKFFGTGYWEKQYKPHIVNFALICLKESDHRQQLEEVWIDVNTDMPKHGVKVIVQHETSNGKDHAFGVYHKDVDMWFYFNGSWKPEDSIEVTHWMPDLPIK